MTSNPDITLPTPPLRMARAALNPDPFSLLVHVYRQAGVPTEIAWRCALADFKSIFPKLLRPGL